MSLESNIADLVSASTRLTQAVNITRAEVDSKQASAAQAAADIVAVKDAVVTAAGQAAASASQAATSLSTTVSDYAAQKVTKGLAAIQTSAEQELADQLHRRDPARYPFRGAKPSLVLDFVRQECHRQNGGELEQVDLNSFMTFTRSSTATFTGPDGVLRTAAVNQPRYDYDPITGEGKGLLIEEQRTNLVAMSGMPGTAPSVGGGWNYLNCTCYPNASIAPDGTMTAAKVVVQAGAATTANDGVGAFANPGVSTTTTTHTVSLYVKDAGVGFFRIRESVNTGQIAKLNLSTGAITAEAGYTSATFTVSATSAGNGWWRVVIVRTPTTSFGFNLKPGIDVGDGISGLYVWGLQLEAGAFPTSYIPTPATFTSRASTKTYFDSTGVMRTAAINEAVTDYGYVDGRWVSKGLSLEPQATNLLTWSGTVSDSSWGLLNGTSVIGSTISLTSQLSRIIKSVALADGTYTLSVRFSAADVGKRVKLSIWHSGNDGFSYPDTTIPDSGVVSVTVVNATGITHVGMINGTAGVAQSVTVVTGFQLETGSVATSYIPTTTTQVTRAADTSTSAQVTRGLDFCAVTNISGWYNPEVGVFKAAARGGKESNQGGYGRLLAGGASCAILGGRTTTGIESWDGATTVSIDGINPQTTVFCAALRYTRATRAISANNSAIVGGGNVGLRVETAGLGIGSMIGSPHNNAWNGTIRSLTYFPRQLSDADLQALTILEN